MAEFITYDLNFINNIDKMNVKKQQHFEALHFNFNQNYLELGRGSSQEKPKYIIVLLIFTCYLFVHTSQSAAKISIDENCSFPPGALLTIAPYLMNFYSLLDSQHFTNFLNSLSLQQFKLSKK